MITNANGTKRLEGTDLVTTDNFNAITDALDANKADLSSVTAKADKTYVDTQLSLKSPTVSPTFTGTTTLQQIKEKINVIASVPTINIDLLSGAINYFTTANTANFTLNFRGDATNALNTVMNTGESLTLSVMATNGATAYYANVIQIDGTTQTVKWLGGTAPTAGNASAIDVYSFTIIKTASATYTVLGSISKFA